MLCQQQICLLFAASSVLRAIKWSENLDNIFVNNYRMDPSLSWQYFGSSYGFMRQYPGEYFTLNRCFHARFEHISMISVADTILSWSGTLKKHVSNLSKKQKKRL